MPTLNPITLQIRDPDLKKKYYYDHTRRIFFTIILLTILRIARIMYTTLTLAMQPKVYA